MNQPFYDIIVDDYADNAHLCARMYQNGQCSVRLKKGDDVIHEDKDRQLIEAFIQRAHEKLTGGKVPQYKIAFDYKNHRLHFNVKKGGVISQSISRRIPNRAGVVFDSKDDIFYGEGNDIMDKFRSMQDCAMGFVALVNYKKSVR